MYKAPNGDWISVPDARYANEEELHTLLAANPGILPVADLDGTEQPSLVTVGRETALGSGYADLICVDTTGRVTLVEVKLRRNPEARREVVAQALSYAAYLEGMTAGDFVDQVWRPYATDVHGPEIAELEMAEGISRISLIDIDGSAFDAGLSDSLTNGAFRILIVMDEPHPQLRRSVSYVNRHADFDLYLVEVGFFKSGDGQHEILSPRLLDSLTQATEPRAPRGKWSLDDFKEFAAQFPETAGPMLTLVARLEEMHTQGTIELALGVGATRPSLKVQIPDIGKSIIWITPSGNINMPSYSLLSLGVDESVVTRLMSLIASPSGLSEDAYVGKVEPRLATPETFNDSVVAGIEQAIEEALRAVASVDV